MSATTLILVCLLAAPLVFAAAAPEYGVARTATALETLLGAADEPWTEAARIAWGPSQYETAFRALWDDQGLYLRFDVTDPNPWHTMTRKDEHLWDEEVVEIFIDLDHSGRDYYELEINPANVVCDLRMVSPWPDKEGDIDWDFEGLETRVHARTDAAGTTTGWTAAAFLPWSGFRPLPSARDIALPPKPDDSWRVNVFRIKRPGGPDAPEKDAVFAAWSPPSVSSFHDPGAFRPFTFQAAP
jgi:hypothetical protein